jgi:zinc transporter 1
LSILLQSIDRFISVPEIDHPLWVLIVGCCGLALNVLSILLVHGTSPSHSPTGVRCSVLRARQYRRSQ